MTTQVRRQQSAAAAATDLVRLLLLPNDGRPSPRPVHQPAHIPGRWPVEQGLLAPREIVQEQRRHRPGALVDVQQQEKWNRRLESHQTRLYGVTAPTVESF